MIDGTETTPRAIDLQTLEVLERQLIAERHRNSLLHARLERLQQHAPLWLLGAVRLSRSRKLLVACACAVAVFITNVAVSAITAALTVLLAG